MGSKYNTHLAGTEIPQLGWYTVGTVAATTPADGVLGVTERDFATADALTNSASIKIPLEITTNIEIRVLFATDNEDTVMDVWMMRDGDTELKMVCQLTCKGGAQTIVIGEDTYYLADTLTVANSTQWPTTPVTSGNGADTMAITRLNPDGYTTILFHGHTTCDEDVIVQISGY